MTQNYITKPLDLEPSKNDLSFNFPAAEVNKLDQTLDDNLNKDVTSNDFNFQKHNGTDAERIDPRNLLGFQIFRTVPTFVAEEGKIVLYWDGMVTYRLYARINKGWHFVNLT